jgi:tetratricopeptide (TPR) repeat protein
MTSKSSVMKALGVYVAASWAIIQVIDVLAQNLGLPSWAFGYALVLLAIGFPIVGVTAFLNGMKVRREGVTEAREGARRVFRWRNALLGGVAAFALFGVTLAGYWTMWSLGIGPLGSLIAKGVLEEDDLVLLSTFENETPDAQLASVVTGTLRVDLERSNSIRLVPETYLENVLRRMGRDSVQSVGPELAREAAIREGIKAVIEGEVASLGPSFVLTARIVDPESGSSYASFRETADTDADLIDALDRLSASVRERAGESLRSIAAGEPLAAVTTQSLDALKRYTEAIRIEEEGDPLGAIALLEQALAEDPAFAMAHRKLAVIHGNRAEFELRDEYAARAYEYRHRLSEIERHVAAAYYHQTVGDRPAMMREYEAALRLDPNESSALNNLAVQYRIEGRLEEAVELLQRAAAGTGESNTAYANLVEDQLELGDVQGARITLQRFEERFPEQYWMHRARALLGISTGDAGAVHAAVVEILADPGASGGRQRGAMRYQASVDWRLGRLRESAEHSLEAAAHADSAGFPVTAAFHEADAASALLESGDPLLADVVARLRGRLGAGVREVGPDLAWIYAERGDRAALTALADDVRSWPEEVQGEALVVQALERGVAADPVAFDLLQEAETRIDCAGCLRPFEVLVAERLGDWQRVVEGGEDYLARPLNASVPLARAPAIQLRVARAYEQLGRRGEAARLYRAYAEIRAGGDPGVQPRVREAAERAEAPGVDGA